MTGSSLELIQDDGRSSLELVTDDETVRAPKQDHDATAFELDASCLAPEVLPGTAPQVLYRASLPEVHCSMEESSEVSVVRDTPKLTLKWLWLLMGVVLVAAVAVGASVGIWHIRREDSSGNSRPVASPSNPASPTARTPSAPTPNNASTAQYILNDTSLAAVVLPNNDRHLYFQDSTGRIRSVIYTASTNQWNTSPDSNISANAKKHTPLAVTAFVPDGPVKIELFYVSQNHQLSSSITNGSMRVWQSDGSLTKYTTAPDTRSLSVTSNLQAISSETKGDSIDLTLTNNITFTSSEVTTTTMSVLFYESSNGSVAALSRLANRCSENCPYGSSENPIYTGDDRKSSWIDNSPALRGLCAASPDQLNGSCGAPFGSSQWLGGTNFSVITSFRGVLKNSSQAVIGTIIYTPLKSSEDPDIQIDVTAPFSTPSDRGSGQQSDWAVISNNDGQGVIWINKSKPAIENLSGYLTISVPKRSFPFERLASVSTLDNKTTYLYHQMNGTTFAEESFQETVGDWAATTYITFGAPP